MDNIGKLLYNVSDLAKPDQAPKRCVCIPNPYSLRTVDCTDIHLTL